MTPVTPVSIGTAATTVPTRTRGTGTADRPVGVDELRRAWHALQEGQFRGHHHPREQRRTDASHPDQDWAPVETTLPVVGCVGQSGASTLALALATAAGDARVIECAPATASGLVAAATAELGLSPHGWTLGRRGRVSIARTTPAHPTPAHSTAAHPALADLPHPDDPGTGIDLTVLDIGSDLDHVLATPGWLRDHLLQPGPVIVTTTATIPGLRRLETTLTLLGPDRAVVAVLGPPRRRWPRHLTAALGPHATARDRVGLLTVIPTDKHLSTRGLDATPLPPSLLRAAESLLHLTVGSAGPTPERTPA